MLMHFCIFFISILASLNFRVVPLKMQSHSQRNLKRERRNSLFLSWAKMDHRVLGMPERKGRKSSECFRYYTWAPQIVYSQSSFFTCPQCFVFCLFKGQMNPLIFIQEVEMKLAEPGSSAASQTGSNLSPLLSIFDWVRSSKREKTYGQMEMGVWKENDHPRFHRSLRFSTDYDFQWVTMGLVFHFGPFALGSYNKELLKDQADFISLLKHDVSWANIFHKVNEGWM